MRERVPVYTITDSSRVKMMRGSRARQGSQGGDENEDPNRGGTEEESLLGQVTENLAKDMERSSEEVSGERTTDDAENPQANLQGNWESVETIMQEDMQETAAKRSEKVDDPTAVFALQEQLFSYWSEATMELSMNDGREGHLRTATLNINGLSQQKLPVMLLFIKEMKIDILSLQDTRLDENESRMYSKRIRTFFGGTNIQVRIAPVPEAMKRADRVGGQLIIIAGKWAQKVTNFYRDFTNMGLVTGTILQAQSHKVLIISTYWPFKPAEVRDNSQLWNKVQRFLHNKGRKMSPIEYVKITIQERIKIHIKDSIHNVVMVQGDLNSSWGTSAAGGCHRGTDRWAETIALRNPLHSMALEQSKTIHTHWIAKHIGTGVAHQECSWIDHLLIHNNGHPTLLRCGVAEHTDWIVISDHRLIWADIHFPTGGTDAQLIPTYDLPSLPQLDRKSVKKVEFFQRMVEKKVNRLSTELTAEETIEKIADITVNLCRKTQKRQLTF